MNSTKPFDLEAAKAGKPVQMRNGTPVKRILASDLAFPGYPLLIGWEDSRGYENTEMYTADGRPNLHGSCCDDSRDLVMTPETVIGWVNVFTIHSGSYGLQRAQVFNTEDEARAEADGTCVNFKSAKGRYVGTFPLTFTV